MTPETALLILPTATMTITGLGVVALRHGRTRYVFLTLAGLLFIAVLFLLPFWEEAGELFILWRLMIMTVLGAASLVIMGVNALFGGLIAGAILLIAWLITRRGTAIPVWIVAAVCAVVCISVGQTLEY